MRFNKRLAGERLEPRELMAADLELVSVSLANSQGEVTAQPPVVGELVYAVAHWRTTDLTPGDVYRIRWDLDGGEPEELEFSGVEGTSVDVTWHFGGWIATAGDSHIVTVTVDSSETVPEENEENNTLATEPFTALAPVIQVFADPGGDGTGIENGGPSPVDFGAVAFGVAGPTRTFIVENQGGAPLSIAGLNLPAEFTLVEELSSELAPGMSDSFTVRMATTPAGRRSGVVQILSNDLNSPSFTFLAEGTVGAPTYFVATTPAHGAELWRTDGTAAGTRLVRDIHPGPDGSNPRHLTLVGGVLYFAAERGIGGEELWKSDGTFTGTVRVKDIAPFAISSSPSDLINLGGVLYFFATTPTAGRELWRSDGTLQGTVVVKNIGPGADDGVVGSSGGEQVALVKVGDALYFAANEGLTGVELWKSDGTAEGTVPLGDFFAGEGSSSPGDLVDLDGTLFFTATDATLGFGLWKSDGTAEGTAWVRALEPAGSLARIYPTVVGGSIYFVAQDQNGAELWTSDGSTDGTRPVKDINPGAASSMPLDEPPEIVNVNGTVFFAAANPAGGRELWKSDGTPVGTVRIKDVYFGSAGSDPAELVNVDGTLYFAATKFIPPVPEPPPIITLRTHADRQGLRVGAMILDPTWNTPAQQAFVASQFNAATVGTYWLRTRPSATEYDWSLTDAAVGWAASAGLAIHLHPLLYPANQHNPAWVLASDPADALQMLQEHITTAMDRYRAGGAYNPTANVVWDVVNEAVGPNGQYRDSWWLQALPPVEGSPVPEYVIRAFEFARAADPNATLVYNDHDIELSSSYHTGKWLRVQEIVAELAARGLIDGVGWQLHVTPDEVLGESFVLQERMAWVRSLGLANFVTELDMPLGLGEDALSRQASAYERVANVWLAERNGGWLQTWGVFDGYSWLGNHAQPLLFDQNYQPKPAYVRLLAVLGSGAPPADPTPTSAAFTGPGRELWKSDGTAAGTVRVRDIRLGPDSSDPIELTNVGGVLYFSADNGVKGRELWTSDGTAAGTRSIKDIVVGIGGSAPRDVAASDFTATVIATVGGSAFSAAQSARDAIFAAGDFTELFAPSPRRGARPRVRGGFA